ncbi:MAG: MotA/TolQ/ExbB proton channel family protein [Hydrogenimonas sp.]|nr:MAG: MotA/TolQ/ExbB proton channel family protein [Hydrogenimonas sp.]
MAETLSNLFQQFLLYMQSGGFVMWPLLVLTIILWYAIGYRFHTLKRGSKKSVRVLIRKYLTGKRQKTKGLIDRAIVDAIEAVNGKCDGKRGREIIEDLFFPYYQDLKRYRKVISTIVMVAPLIGLLGTVIGMIETFDSLASMALFTQGGGIAAGISQALFTTQLGLVVAVPGLIMGRMLDNKANMMELELEQIKDILCAEKGLDNEI